MGTPLPKNEPGTFCSICWGPGKPLGPGPTPKFVYCTLSGVEVNPGVAVPVPGPPNRKFFLAQHPTISRWQCFGSDWEVTWWIGGSFTICSAVIPSTAAGFVANVPDLCQTDFVNGYGASGSPYRFGTAKISWDTDGV